MNHRRAPSLWQDRQWCHLFYEYLAVFRDFTNVFNALAAARVRDA
jgi:hypothetical protein